MALFPAWQGFSSSKVLPINSGVLWVTYYQHLLPCLTRTSDAKPAYSSQVNRHPMCSGMGNKASQVPSQETEIGGNPHQDKEGYFSCTNSPCHFWKGQGNDGVSRSFTCREWHKTKDVITCDQRSRCIFTSTLIVAHGYQPLEPCEYEFLLLLCMISNILCDCWVPEFCSKSPNYLTLHVVVKWNLTS